MDKGTRAGMSSEVQLLEPWEQKSSPEPEACIARIVPNPEADQDQAVDILTENLKLLLDLLLLDLPLRPLPNMSLIVGPIGRKKAEVAVALEVHQGAVVAITMITTPMILMASVLHGLQEA
jgi:hypothetical protein